MSAAFHPLSIVAVVVVLPSVSVPKATRADDSSRGAALPPHYFPYARDGGTKRCSRRRFATRLRPRSYATPPARRTDPPLGRR